MDNKVLTRLKELCQDPHSVSRHPEILADLFLEEGIRVQVHDICYDTFPDPKVTLNIQVYL